ncbi:hypothetical protein BC827DRAFT_213716 [Russula dissimulans]|nr:hypothetical protein BC827DRAFT_213716 [Russula dissimulans]
MPRPILPSQDNTLCSPLSLCFLNSAHSPHTSISLPTRHLHSQLVLFDVSHFRVNLTSLSRGRLPPIFQNGVRNPFLLHLLTPSRRFPDVAHYVSPLVQTGLSLVRQFVSCGCHHVQSLSKASCAFIPLPLPPVNNNLSSRSHLLSTPFLSRTLVVSLTLSSLASLAFWHTCPGHPVSLACDTSHRFYLTLLCYLSDYRPLVFSRRWCLPIISLLGASPLDIRG